jgi:hypothetical protein
MHYKIRSLVTRVAKSTHVFLHLCKKETLAIGPTIAPRLVAFRAVRLVGHPTVVVAPCYLFKIVATQHFGP